MACQAVVLERVGGCLMINGPPSLTPAWQPSLLRCAPSEGWRRGQESNLPRFLRTDHGFEDREGHQAPFTLRKEEKENVQRSTLNAQRPITEKEKDDRLLELFDRGDDVVEVGPVTGIEFGMEQFAIGANFKSAAARRNERERFDAFAEFKNLGRQTDGLGRVVSNDAIFDRDFVFHPASSFPQSWYEVTETWSRCGTVVRSRRCHPEQSEGSLNKWLVALRSLRDPRFDCEIPPAFA